MKIKFKETIYNTHNEDLLDILNLTSDEYMEKYGRLKIWVSLIGKDISGGIQITNNEQIGSEDKSKEIEFHVCHNAYDYDISSNSLHFTINTEYGISNTIVLNTIEFFMKEFDLYEPK